MNGKKGKLPSYDSNVGVTLGRKTFAIIVKFIVDDETLEFDVNEKLEIPSIDRLTPARICNMMAENPSVHARWNVLSNQAAVKYDYAKVDFEVWTKGRSKHYRKELAETIGKRITDKMVEEAVMTDPEYMRKFGELCKIKEDAANLKSIAIGFGERGERLVNILSAMKSEKPTSSTSSRGDEDEAEHRAFNTDSESA
ncbi:MAG: hypothetical protein Q7R33_00835 [Nitrosarchaeum sp.]|nr:hypothetical protein [Nitrosarchaeum sp.]